MNYSCFVIAFHRWCTTKSMSFGGPSLFLLDPGKGNTRRFSHDAHGRCSAMKRHQNDAIAGRAQRNFEAHDRHALTAGDWLRLAPVPLMIEYLRLPSRHLVCQTNSSDSAGTVTFL